MGVRRTERLVRRITTPGCAALLLAVGAAGGAAAIAVADEPDAGNVIHACLRLATPGQTVPLTTAANLTVIDTDAGQTCSSPSDPKVPETELTWNTAGQPGPAGPPGPAGANGTNGAPGQKGADGLPGEDNASTITLPPITGNSASFGKVTLSVNGRPLTFGILGLSTLGKGASGTGAGASARVNVHDLVITKPTDSASPKLYAAVSKGTHIPKATLIVRKSGKGPLLELFRLTNVAINSIQLGARGGNRPQENVSLTYKTLTVTYKPQTQVGDKK
ncbi:MAG: Hcp family type VI secretion system effector [Solirubrobacteraceae bacterium]